MVPCQSSLGRVKIRNCISVLKLLTCFAPFSSFVSSLAHLDNISSAVGGGSSGWGQQLGYKLERFVISDVKASRTTSDKFKASEQHRMLKYTHAVSNHHSFSFNIVYKRNKCCRCTSSVFECYCSEHVVYAIPSHHVLEREQHWFGGERFAVERLCSWRHSCRACSRLRTSSWCSDMRQRATQCALVCQYSRWPRDGLATHRKFWCVVRNRGGSSACWFEGIEPTPDVSCGSGLVLRVSHRATRDWTKPIDSFPRGSNLIAYFLWNERVIPSSDIFFSFFYVHRISIVVFLWVFLLLSEVLRPLQSLSPLWFRILSAVFQLAASAMKRPTFLVLIQGWY